MQVGDRINWNGYENCTITKVFKNGKVNLECWVQGGFMRKPELWKFQAVRP